MITTTHIVINAASARAPKIRDKINANGKWLTLGGLAPDVFLYLASIIWGGYYSLTTTLSSQQVLDLLYDDLFFNNPAWLIGQNFLHAPLVLLGLYLLAQIKNWAALKWFAIGCGLHTLIDIITHHNDGPLLLFPLNWSYRFSSPVSYWDPDYYGNILGSVDLTITIVGGLAFLILWLRHRGSD